MQLTHLIALVPVLQAVSAFPYVYDTYDLYARDLDALLYPGSQQLYARAALFPRGESDTPTVPLTSKKHPQTIKNKIAGGLPSETQMLPPGEKPYRGDQGNLHGTKGETVVDHAIEASSVEGKKASKEGKNSLMEVPKAEQDCMQFSPSPSNSVVRSKADIVFQRRVVSRQQHTARLTSKVLISSGTRLMASPLVRLPAAALSLAADPAASVARPQLPKTVTGTRSVISSLVTLLLMLTLRHLLFSTTRSTWRCRREMRSLSLSPKLSPSRRSMVTTTRWYSSECDAKELMLKIVN